MPRPHSAVREKVLAETRQRLLEAAAAEFAREGYVGANIKRISLAAGFAKGTIYNHFASKRDLMLALIDHIAAVHVAFILERAEAEENPTRRLEGFFEAGFAFVHSHPTQIPVVINAIYGPDVEFKEHVYQSYERLFLWIIQDVLKAGVVCGDFDPLDADLTTALLMTIYLGSCSLAGADGKIELDPDQVLAFILNGIRKRSEGTGMGHG